MPNAYKIPAVPDGSSTVNQRLGYILYQLRIHHQCSRYALAKMLGTSTTRISALEHGSRPLPIRTIDKIAACFGYRATLKLEKIAEYVPRTALRRKRQADEKTQNQDTAS